VKPVLLRGGEPGMITRAVVEHAPRSVPEALQLATSLADLRPFVGAGRTHDLWEALATLGSEDVGLVRAVEPHIDAITILTQAGRQFGPSDTFGVFAAEGPGVRLAASAAAGRWQLDGVKAWCSLASVLSHALVTAWVSDADRRLFLVDLRQPGVAVDDTAWSARGLQEIPSGPVSFRAVAAEPVGEPGWYLQRRGFAWGGMSVAACWFGGAVGVGRRLLESARRRSSDDPLQLMHLGAVDARLAESRTVLADAASQLDGGGSRSDDLLAQRVRATVARTCEEVLQQVGHALGPGPLATDPAHAKRVADLGLYIRQHHAERDDVSLGRRIRDVETTW
jgi:alkylation response protein AidB-like acyl-CoA dehydrogenase